MRHALPLALLATLSLSAVSLGACSRQDRAETHADLKAAADKTAQAAKDVAADAKDAFKEAGADLKSGAAEAKADVDQHVDHKN